MERNTSPRRSKTMWNLSDFSKGAAFFFLLCLKNNVILGSRKLLTPASGKQKHPWCPSTVRTQAELLQPLGSVARALSLHGFWKGTKIKLCNCADLEVCISWRAAFMLQSCCTQRCYAQGLQETGSHLTWIAQLQ